MVIIPSGPFSKTVGCLMRPAEGREIGKETGEADGGTELREQAGDAKGPAKTVAGAGRRCKGTPGATALCQLRGSGRVTALRQAVGHCLAGRRPEARLSILVLDALHVAAARAPAPALAASPSHRDCGKSHGR